MNFGRMCHLLLQRLSEDAGKVLQLVHDTRFQDFRSLEAELTAAKIPNVEVCLLQLEQFGLVAHVDGLWETTWAGAGVSNCRTQQLCQADQRTQPSTQND